MKQTIFLFSLCLLSLTLFAQKKQKQANIKVDAHAYRYNPKVFIAEVFNPTKYHVIVHRAWCGQKITFVQEEELAQYNPESLGSVSVPSVPLKDYNIPPPIAYKGIMLIEYSINGKIQYYIVKKHKIIDLPAIPKREHKRNRGAIVLDPSRT
jgi:hypothetical protein